MKLSETLRRHGLESALRDVLATRDALEPTVRLLVAPDSLRRLRGHLLVAVPLLALFLALLAGVVWERSGSPLLALAATLLVPCFPFVHDPVAGLSDYWRESTATWLLGSAWVCWLQSDGLRRRGWGTGCGALVAALILTRQVAGAYALASLAPCVVQTLPRAFGRAADPAVRARLVRLVLPIAGAAALVVLLAGQKLYTYYVVTAWSYGGAGDVVRYLEALVPERLGIGPLAVAAALAAPRRHLSRRAWLAVAWLCVSMPLVAVLSGGLYHGTFALATPMLVVAGAWALCAKRGAHPAAAAALVALLAFLGAAQHVRMRRHSLAVAALVQPTRQFYRALTDAVLDGDPSARYGLLFDAVDTLFVNTAFFDRGIWPSGTVSFHSVVDSYYRQHFPGLDARAAGRANLEALARPGTRAAAFCTAADAARSLPAQPFAREAASVASEGLRDGPRWKALRRFDAPVGCVLLYERVETDLAPDEKWATVPDRGLSGP